MSKLNEFLFESQLEKSVEKRQQIESRIVAIYADSKDLYSILLSDEPTDTQSSVILSLERDLLHSLSLIKLATSISISPESSWINFAQATSLGLNYPGMPIGTGNLYSLKQYADSFKPHADKKSARYEEIKKYEQRSDIDKLLSEYSANRITKPDIKYIISCKLEIAHFILSKYISEIADQIKLDYETEIMLFIDDYFKNEVKHDGGTKAYALIRGLTYLASITQLSEKAKKRSTKAYTRLISCLEKFPDKTFTIPKLIFADYHNPKQQQEAKAVKSRIASISKKVVVTVGGVAAIWYAYQLASASDRSIPAIQKTFAMLDAAEKSNIVPSVDKYEPKDALFVRDSLNQRYYFNENNVYTD